MVKGELPKENHVRRSILFVVLTVFVLGVTLAAPGVGRVMADGHMPREASV
jgi:hypothetical protein